MFGETFSKLAVGDKKRRTFLKAFVIGNLFKKVPQSEARKKIK